MLPSPGMSFYVLQVAGSEERYLSRAQRCLDPESQRLWWPRRSLRIRRRGKWLSSVAAIFPGYLFLQAESVTPQLYWDLKGLPGFLRFLKDNQHIEPIGPRDRETLKHFLTYGEVVSRSTVTFDENKRIRVISGPLKDLEGRIVKVDRRKGRARVKLEMYEDSFVIDFGFDSLEASSAPAKS
jgi:transcriptional antiterminator NusG